MHAAATPVGGRNSADSCDLTCPVVKNRTNLHSTVRVSLAAARCMSADGSPVVEWSSVKNKDLDLPDRIDRYVSQRQDDGFRRACMRPRTAGLHAMRAAESHPAPRHAAPWAYQLVPTVQCWYHMRDFFVSFGGEV